MNIYWVIRNGDRIGIVGGRIGTAEPVELAYAQDYAGPYVTHRQADIFAEGWRRELAAELVLISQALETIE